jgi:hypothetical protein
MYISRPSDPHTVLLWGDRCWFAGIRTPREFSNLTHAAEVLAAHFAAEPKPIRLRLIFQPDSLETVEAACPDGNRATLAAALAGEFPALGDSDHAWGHEPVLPAGDRFSTLLHFETQPGLFQFATRLARLGLAVESAWPLTTYLQALPPEWTESGAMTVIAADAGRACAYRHPADAGRTAKAWRGESALAEVGRWLAGIFAQNPEEPVLLFCANDEVAAALEANASPDRHPGLARLLLTEALARPVLLPRYHPAQLLPRLPLFTAQRAVIAASIVFLLAAGWSGIAYARDWRAGQAEVKNRDTRVATLRTEVAHLRDNAAEIAALRGTLDWAAVGPPCGALLEKISATLPPEIALTTLRVSAQGFKVNGWVAPSATAAVLDQWCLHLSGENSPWTVEVKSKPPGIFTIAGVFKR